MVLADRLVRLPRGARGGSEPEVMTMPKRETRNYYYRGQIERGTGHGYRLVNGFSAGEGGTIEYPWMTRRECQVQAKSDGYTAVFVASKGL